MTTESKSFDIDHSSTWTINRVVTAQAEKNPEKSAIEFIGGASYSFKDCKDVALQAAGDLQQAGVTSATNVALMIDSPEHFFRYYGCYQHQYERKPVASPAGNIRIQICYC